jgi:hypothetical protein
MWSGIPGFGLEKGPSPFDSEAGRGDQKLLFVYVTGRPATARPLLRSDSSRRAMFDT